MKKIFFALITSATAVTGVSHAAALDGAYVGVGVASSRYNFDVPNVTSSDNKSGYKATGKVFVGYDFNKTWALEGGYADFGSQHYSYTQNGANDGAINSDSHALYLAGKGTLPLTTQISAFGKLGVAKTYTSISGTGSAAGISGDNKTGLYASVGAQYAINKNVSLTAEVERFGQSANYGHKSTAFALGARYSF